MAEQLTKLEQMINPQVMADMISAKVDKKIVVSKYAKLDTTLQGQAGDTITVPRYAYIGDAVDVAEGEEIPTRKLETTSKAYTIKTCGIGAVLTDKAMLCGYGNPIGQATSQMAMSISAKLDADSMVALYEASTTYTASNVLSYAETVNAIDLFNEETNSEKVMFVHPKQVTQLRLDPDFIAKDKYGNDVMVTGEIGMIGNARIVPTKKVKVEGGYYFNPIVKLTNDAETEDDTYALTVFLKRDTNVETERKSSFRKTEVTGDKMYVVALTDETKVVIAKMKETASV